MAHTVTIRGPFGPNQPFSLGNVRALVANLDITSYTNPNGETVTPAECQLNGLIAIVPAEAFTQGGAANHQINPATPSGGNIAVTAFTLANPPVEAANTVDVGDMEVIIYGW